MNFFIHKGFFLVIFVFLTTTKMLSPKGGILYMRQKGGMSVINYLDFHSGTTLSSVYHPLKFYDI